MLVYLNKACLTFLLHTLADKRSGVGFEGFPSSPHPACSPQAKGPGYGPGRYSSPITHLLLSPYLPFYTQW